MDPPAAAARLLGVSPAQLETHTAAGEQAGISVTLGWRRHWHAPSLPGWWRRRPAGARPPPPGMPAAPRGARVRAAVTAGITWTQAAREEGVSMHTVWRGLRLDR